MNDKEGRNWLLQKLYDRGFKYITSWTGGNLLYAGVDKVRLAGGDDEN